MPVVSISMNERLLEELDRIQREMGYSGRSEAIRAGIRMLVTDSREKERLRGEVRGVLLVIHDHAAENMINDVKHMYVDVIHTQLHNRIRDGKCLEVFILDGEAERVRGLTMDLQRGEKNEYVKLLTV